MGIGQAHRYHLVLESTILIFLDFPQVSPFNVKVENQYVLPRALAINLMLNTFTSASDHLAMN